LKLWTNTEGGCLNACLASLAGCHPADVPYGDDEPLDLDRINRWLRPRGRRLEPVHAGATWGDSYPSGDWIALLARRPGVCHAVLCTGRQIVHDPGFANGWSGNLWPTDLAYASDRSVPLGYQLLRYG
jgi:hypothetical protein